MTNKVEQGKPPQNYTDSSVTSGPGSNDIMTDQDTTERDYSKTLFLPQTDFPMRAGLPKKEPEIKVRETAAKSGSPGPKKT